MSQFSVYRAPKSGGYILNVQSPLLGELGTRVVIPLLPAASVSKPTKKLNPQFEIEGQKYVLATQFVVAIPTRDLKAPIADLGEHHSEITDALDCLIQGV